MAIRRANGVFGRPCAPMVFPATCRSRLSKMPRGRGAHLQDHRSNALAATIDREAVQSPALLIVGTVVQSNAAVIRTLFAQAASRAHTEFVNA